MTKNLKNKDFIFSIIIDISTEIDTSNLLQNLENQTINFNQDIQIILIKDSNNKIQEKVDNKNNITVVDKKDFQKLWKYPTKYIKGQYINLFSSNNFLPYNTLEEIQKCFNEESINVIKLQTANITNNDIKFNFINDYKIIEFDNQSNLQLLDVNNFFIKKEELLKYITKLATDSPLEVILNKILFYDKKYIQFNHLKIYKNLQINEYYLKNKLNIYNRYIQSSLSIKNKIPLYMQFALINDLNDTIESIKQCNIMHYDFFYDALTEILSYSSVKTILKNSNVKRNNRTLLMSLKNKNNPDLTIYDKNKTLLNYKNYKYSFIIALNENSHKLSLTLNSILKQSYNLDEIQIILVSNNNTSETFNEAIDYYKKYPNNIIIITKNVPTIAALRNLGIAYIKGDYINFIECGDYVESELLDKTSIFLKKYDKEVDIIVIPRYTFDDEILDDGLDYIYDLGEIINVNDNPNTPLIYVSNTFIKYDQIKSREFSTNLLCSEETLLINKILFNKKKYGIITESKYYSRYFIEAFPPREKYVRNIPRYYNREEFNYIPIEDNKRFYTQRIKLFYQDLINYYLNKQQEVPLFIQITLTYDIVKLINIRNLTILNETEKNDFFKEFILVLQYIEEKALKNRHIQKYERSFIMYLKNSFSKNIEIDNENNIELKTGKYIIDELNNHLIAIDQLGIYNSKLTILGNFLSNFNYDNLNISIKEKYDNKTIIHQSKQLFYPQYIRRTRSYLSIDWVYNYNFEFTIDLREEDSLLQFELIFNDNYKTITLHPDIMFGKNTGLSYMRNFTNDGKIVTITNDSQIFIVNYNYLRHICCEMDNLSKIIENKEEGYKEAIFLRLIYILLYPYMKSKKIWLYSDRPTIADDNARHLFEYSIKQNDGIKKYYVINKNCDDYYNMKKISKNILAARSFKHKILFLFNDKIISPFFNLTYSTPIYYEGIYDHRNLYCNLLESRRYFLQHGVTQRNVKNQFKRFSDEVSLINTSAEREKDFINSNYNYPKETVQLLGFPRYDNLTSDNSKKEIIYMPTWRSYLDKNEELFLNSDYFKCMNEFLTDEKLHQYIEDCGYVFKFKPHPELLKYSNHFMLDKHIIISTEESYQEIFRDGSLLITDFSSVVFDFAYLKKPIIYYQPNNDHHSPEGYFSYQKDGFGPVAKNIKELFQYIKEYIENNCEMEDEYKERVTSFFKYNDKNNCKRVYEFILNDN